jgi:endonuclease YncB( thermonuclease family)
MAFARAYPEGPPDSSLKWGHYRELLVLPDVEQRAWYAAQADKQGWSAPKLREAVREQRFRNRSADGSGSSSKRQVALRRPTGTPYVYKATIERVVDGDTLLAMIDLGFQVHRSQRLRLAGIDTPARDTPKGARAKELVEDQLSEVPYVILKTDKIDLYGRYVAHVFYAADETDKHRIFTEGQYLNQRLVDEKLAKVL